MVDWIDIGSLEVIAQRGARVIKTILGCVAVLRTGDDKVFAITDRCPHKGGPLSDGVVHGNSVTCPLHNWVFSLETGMAQWADTGSVQTYAARDEYGRVILGQSQLRAQSAA